MARVLLAGSFVAWTAAFAAAGAGRPALAAASGALSDSVGAALAAAPQRTSNDSLYTKAQADGAKAQFNKLCADCHPFTVAAKKKPKDLPLGDEPFFDTWEGRPLAQLVTTIALTMPNDGSAVVSEAEAVNLVAYILQQNGFPAGANALTKETAAAVLARPKK